MSLTLSIHDTDGVQAWLNEETLEGITINPAYLGRKNMSLKNLVKWINYYYLQEFLYITLRKEGLFRPSMCDSKMTCPMFRVGRYLK